MKKKLFLIASMVMFSVNVMADAVKPFDKIKVNMPASVKVIKGDKYSVHVESEDLYTAKLVRYTVKDNTLNITLHRSGNQTITSDNIKITIVSPKDQEMVNGRNTEIKKTEKK